jgi:(p)ppGpp synthase/HD superfamily hydrolase
MSASATQGLLRAGSQRRDDTRYAESVPALELGVRRADAIAFLLDAYDRVATRPGKGIPHAQAVADILRDSGRDETTQLVGLLHDVAEHTPRTIDDLRAAFGDDVADMVAALTEDEHVDQYAPRKRLLRGQIVAAGSPVVDVALADKIATLRHALITGTIVTDRQLQHYRATLRLARAAGIAADLCDQLQRSLARFPLVGGATSSPTPAHEAR